MDRGLAVAHEALEQVGLYAQDLQAVDVTLRPSDAVTAEERQAQFLSLQEAWQASTAPIQQHCAKMRRSFEPGLFVGGETADFPTDNLDLERWFKGPRLILDSRVVIGQVWRNRLFLQALRGGRGRCDIFEKSRLISSV